MTAFHYRKIITIIALAIFGGSPLLPPSASAQAPATEKAEKPTVIVTITRGEDDLHAVSMAIGLASNAIKAGRRSIIFLTVRAPILAAANLPTNVKFADFPPVKEMLESFVADGGELYVCGHCAGVWNVNESNLIKGATLLQHGEIFKKVPVTALTFSY